MEVTAAFITQGCKVNQYDTQVMRSQLCADGYEVVDLSSDPGPGVSPDVIIVNSCTVTAESDRKTGQILRRCRRQYPNALLVLTGCMPQAYPEEAGVLSADIVLGNAANHFLPALIAQRLATGRKIIRQASHPVGELFEKTGAISEFHGRTRAFMKIEDGCDRFCAYCAVPYARGHVRSRALPEVFAEAERLADAGYKEIVLCGVNLTSYGTGENFTLADAVSTVGQVPGICRVRLGSMEPDQLTEETLCRLAAEEKFCPEFHLSLQSGCDATLARMNRHYSTRLYFDLCKRIRSLFPLPAITTDVMVGFPGETENEFLTSLQTVSKCEFAKVHVFPYSPRPGTAACQLSDQVPAAVKAERAKRMSEVVGQSRRRFLASQIGLTVSVLLEGSSKGGTGYTPNYTPVTIADVCHSDLDVGDIVLCKLIGLHDDETCVGELLNSAEAS